MMIVSDSELFFKDVHVYQRDSVSRIFKINQSDFANFQNLWSSF